MSIADEAAELSVAMLLALVKPAEIVAWADDWILRQAEPSDALLDLCIMNTAHPQDLIGSLDSIAGSYRVIDKLPLAVRRAPKLLEEEGIPFGRTLAKAMYGIYVAEGYDVPDELSAMSWFDDAFDLARGGYAGTEEEVLAELKKFVASAADAR